VSNCYAHCLCGGLQGQLLLLFAVRCVHFTSDHERRMLVPGIDALIHHISVGGEPEALVRARIALLACHQGDIAFVRNHWRSAGRMPAVTHRDLGDETNRLVSLFFADQW